MRAFTVQHSSSPLERRPRSSLELKTQSRSPGARRSNVRVDDALAHQHRLSHLGELRRRLHASRCQPPAQERRIRRRESTVLRDTSVLPLLRGVCATCPTTASPSTLVIETSGGGPTSCAWCDVCRSTRAAASVAIALSRAIQAAIAQKVEFAGFQTQPKSKHVVFFLVCCCTGCG